MTTWQDIGPEGRPVRIQRKRTKGWRMPPNTVSVTRPGPYGNPFVVGEFPSIAYAHVWNERVPDAATAVRLFRQLLMPTLLRHDSSVDTLIKLRGKNLACFCPLGQPCHADVLLELANLPSPPSKEGERQEGRS